MVFGAITTLYLPTAANAGASQWGTDVRKVLDTADAGTDQTTLTNHGTGGSVVRTCDPYTTLNTDSDQTLFGWAVNPTDMGSTTAAPRHYAAGNHSCTFRFSQTAAAGASITVTMFVYQVGNAAGGRVRTLLGSGNVTFNSDASGTVSTRVVTAALGAILFGDDETIQYSFEITAPGVAITGRNCRLITGTQGGVAIRVDTPVLGTKQFLTTTGFDTPVTFGTTGLRQTVTPAGFDPAVSFGTPTLVQTQDVTPAGFDIAVAFGTPTLIQQQFLDVDGFDVPVTFGTPTLIQDNVLTVSGFDLGISFGTPTLAGQPTITGTVFNHETGNPVGAGVVVKLFDDNDLLIDSTVTDAGGSYLFFRPFGDTDLYWTLAYYDVLGVQFHGVSDRSCPAT
jgi:hypothetical protein